MTPPDWINGFGPDRLEEYIAAVDACGGPHGEAFIAMVAGFRYIPNAVVDQSVDPFSDDYFSQMIGLYEEISGRALDQSTGELHHFDVEHHVSGVNPYALPDISFISRHARAVLTALMVANPPPAARVIDLGCGWGLSTEMIGFTGAEVTAVDINPAFVELVRRRAERHGRVVRTVVSNFDDLELDGDYDLALFLTCLHHASRPWETIARVARFLKPDGRIVIVGEPIDDTWWRHWGLRLDPVSVYCIRKFGWFESGWSAPFISECFARAGFTLSIFPGIGLEDGPLGVAERNGAANPRPLGLPAARFLPPPPAVAPVAAETPPAPPRRRGLLRRIF